MLYVDGMNGVIGHAETIQWLYTLVGSKVEFSILQNNKKKNSPVIVQSALFLDFYTQKHKQTLVRVTVDCVLTSGWCLSMVLWFPFKAPCVFFIFIFKFYSCFPVLICPCFKYMLFI